MSELLDRINVIRTTCCPRPTFTLEMGRSETYRHGRLVLYAHSVYERNSVLAGQPRRLFVDQWATGTRPEPPSPKSAGGTDQQVAVFDALAQGGEKITASRAKVKRQEVHEATGEGGPVPRTLKQFKAFLEGKTGPADPGHRLAAYLLDYLAGKRSEEAMDRYWDRAFALEAGPRLTG